MSGTGTFASWAGWFKVAEVECPCCLGDGDHCDPDFPGCTECDSTGSVSLAQNFQWKTSGPVGHKL